MKRQAVVRPGLDAGIVERHERIVLAMLRPSLHVVLLEPLLRRSVFLDECVRELDLPNVRVIRARAEEKAAAGISADVATARAVASLEKLVGWAARLLRPGASEAWGSEG